MSPQRQALQAQIGEEQIASALHAVRLTQPRPSDSVAVVGDGALALACVVVLLARGVGKVGLVASSAEWTARASGTGVMVLSNPTSTEGLDGIRARLGGYGADYVYACESGSEPIQLAIEIARPAGMIVLLGQHSHPASINPNLLVFADKRVQGSGRPTAEECEVARDLMFAGRFPT
jgi:threonine dehydrogenase-like Zn-dependent dehydrogenase